MLENSVQNSGNLEFVQERKGLMEFDIIPNCTIIISN